MLHSTDYSRLRKELDLIEQKHVEKNQIQNDPLSSVIKFESKNDREVVALIAAVFAYGNVKQILNSIDKILKLLGPTPAHKLTNSDGHYWKKNIPQNFKHRFNTANDLGILLTWLGEALRSNENLEDFFLGDLKSPLVFDLLENFIQRITSLPCKPYKVPKSRGPYFFFPKPSNKSGCKRLLLFLRWMAGSGPMALGIWKKLDPAFLIIPVDTHVLRISKNLGLTKRKDASWKTAVEITSALKNISPDDPTRYDFALCHMGISQACPSRFKITVCQMCQMNSLCKNYRQALTKKQTHSN